MPSLYEVYPYIFTRGHTRHLNKAALVDTIRWHQIGLVLNVALIDDEELRRLLYPHVDHRFMPMHDSRHLDEARVREAADLVASTVLSGRRVVVHCDSGWNRSALVAMLAASRLERRKIVGLRMAGLIAEARKVRGPRLLKNRAFERYLLSTEER